MRQRMTAAVVHTHRAADKAVVAVPSAELSGRPLPRRERGKPFIQSRVSAAKHMKCSRSARVIVHRQPPRAFTDGGVNKK